MEEGSSSFLGFLLLLYADLFFDVSLMAGLHHQFVAVQTGKPPLLSAVCCAAGLLRYKPENRVSFGGTLRR
mgnify:FL=1